MEQTYELIRYGTVVDTYNTGKGYAFVTFDNKEDASTVSVTTPHLVQHQF